MECDPPMKSAALGNLFCYTHYDKGILIKREWRSIIKEMSGADILKMTFLSCKRNVKFALLTLNPPTWKIRRAPNNASKWQMGFNSAFKGLRTRIISVRFKQPEVFFKYLIRQFLALVYGAGITSGYIASNTWRWTNWGLEVAENSRRDLIPALLRHWRGRLRKTTRHFSQITFSRMGIRTVYISIQTFCDIDLICTNVCTCIYEYNIT